MVVELSVVVLEEVEEESFDEFMINLISEKDRDNEVDPKSRTVSLMN